VTALQTRTRRLPETDARERFHRAVADLAAEPSVATVVRYLRASDGLAAAEAERATGASADGATLHGSAGL
jgi:hypothetical protein